MDEKEKAKRFVSRSRRTKHQHRGSHHKAKIEAKQAASSRWQRVKPKVSTSNSALSPTKEKEKREREEKERKEREEKEEKEKKEREEREKKEREEREKKEREEREKREQFTSAEKKNEEMDRRRLGRKNCDPFEKDADSDSDFELDLGLRMSHVAIASRKGKPRKVAIKHRDIDDKETEKLLKKLKDHRAHPTRVTVPLDEKSKILMDRIEKKAYPAKYHRKNKAQFLTEDDTEFFKPPVAQTNSLMVVVEEDAYENVPKLADVEKMPDENVYRTSLMAGQVPFWAMYLEPDESDMKDVEPPISVGSEHIEAYHDKKITLKTNKATKLVLDEFQPSNLLVQRDEKFFHPHLIFSNTVRSLINVQGQATEKMGSKQRQKRSDDDYYKDREQPTQFDGNNVVMAKKPPISFKYDRARPIISARDEKDRLRDKLQTKGFNFSSK